MGKIKTKHNWYENTSISFDANGMWVRVSLNIPPGLAKHLSQNNVQKGKARTVYALRQHVSNDMVCRNTVETVHRLLLTNCMNNIRKAKEKWEGKKIHKQ